MKTVYFVRHGLSEGNVAGVTSGAEHNVPLTEEGKQQALRAGRDLRDKNIDLVVCSPLIRTVQTAELIAGELGYDPKKILQREDFIERYMGIYSGKPHDEYRAAVLSNTAHESLEKPEQMLERISKGLEWLKTQDAQTIVLVAHGGVGRILRIIHEALELDDMYKIEGFANTAIYKFTLQ